MEPFFELSAGALPEVNGRVTRPRKTGSRTARGTKWGDRAELQDDGPSKTDGIRDRFQ
jgi:hypothetical protein